MEMGRGGLCGVDATVIAYVMIDVQLQPNNFPLEMTVR